MKLTNGQNNLILFSLMLLLTGSIIAAYKKFQVPGIAGFKRTDFLAIPKIAGYEPGTAQASFRNDPYKIPGIGRQPEARGFTIDLDDPEGAGNIKTPAAQKQKTAKIQEEHYFDIEPEVKPVKRAKPSPVLKEKEETVLLSEEKEISRMKETAGAEPKTSPRAAPDKRTSQTETEGGRININTAGTEELMKIPFVGKVTAENIIMFRNDTGGYKKIEDIKKVPKMDRYFDRIKDFITVK